MFTLCHSALDGRCLRFLGFLTRCQNISSHLPLESACEVFIAISMKHEACISERISSDTVCVSLVPGWGRVMLGV